MSELIVITGPLRSGKTALAHVLTLDGAYKAQNIGDLLAEQLDRVGVQMQARKDIGAKYIDQFGRDSYHETILRAAGEAVVLDGLRLPSALKLLRDEWSDLIHLARPASPRPANPDPYASDVSELEVAADEVVSWQSSVRNLPRAAEAALIQVHAKRKR